MENIYLYNKRKVICDLPFVMQMNRSTFKFLSTYKYPYEHHSHVSLLIHMGFSAVAIGKRVGHKSEHVTYYYAHMFPGVQEEMADRLDDERR